MVVVLLLRLSGGTFLLVQWNFSSCVLLHTQGLAIGRLQLLRSGVKWLSIHFVRLAICKNCSDLAGQLQSTARHVADAKVKRTSFGMASSADQATRVALGSTASASPPIELSAPPDQGRSDLVHDAVNLHLKAAFSACQKVGFAGTWPVKLPGTHVPATCKKAKTDSAASAVGSHVCGFL